MFRRAGELGENSSVRRAAELSDNSFVRRAAELSEISFRSQGASRPGEEKAPMPLGWEERREGSRVYFANDRLSKRQARVFFIYIYIYIYIYRYSCESESERVGEGE